MLIVINRRNSYKYAKKFLKKFLLFLFILNFCILYYYLRLKFRNKMRPSILIENDYITDTEEGKRLDGQMRINSLKTISEVHSLKKQVQMFNKKQYIHNLHLPGLETVIVVQVHNRILYIEKLIESLERVKDVKKSLLVFSHSYFDENINRIVQNITFAKVMQIFFPYSVQLHPNVYPGNDYLSCTQDFACKRMYRRALSREPKHHWWWKASYIFQKLKVTKHYKYNGYYVFLEEDQYVAEDFLYIKRITEELIKKNYPDTDIISFGTQNPDVNNYHTNKSTIVRKTLDFNNNDALAFNNIVWGIMKRLNYHYCSFPSDKWFNSLVHVGIHTYRGYFNVLSIENPRVFRFENCDSATATCNMVKKLAHVKEFVRKISKYLYPHSFDLKENVTVISKSIGNNGWDDFRDQDLCMFYNKINSQ